MLATVIKTLLIRLGTDGKIGAKKVSTMNIKTSIVVITLLVTLVQARAQQLWDPLAGFPSATSSPTFRTGNTYVGQDPANFPGINTNATLHVLEQCGGYEFQISRVDPGLEGCLSGHVERPFMRVVDWTDDGGGSIAENRRLVFNADGNLGIGEELSDNPPTPLFMHKVLPPSQASHEAIRLHTVFTDAEERIMRFHTKLTGSAFNFMTKDGDFGLIFSDNGDGFNQSAGFVIAPHIGGEGGLRVDKDGKVNIGKWYEQSGSGGFDYELSVKGGILTEEIKVTLWNNWPDYVFGDDYELRSLSDLSAFISEYKHLPGIPSAEEIKATNGVELGEMNRLLLEKIEELTLYIISLQAESTALEKRLSSLEMSDK